MYLQGEVVVKRGWGFRSPGGVSRRIHGKKPCPNPRKRCSSVHVKNFPSS
jgi:hypothetical protein